MAELIINKETKDFTDKVQWLINTDQFQNQIEIAKSLKWSETALSACMNGRRNAPKKIVYRINQIVSSSNFKAIEKSKLYTLDQIMEVVKSELKSSYGGLSKDAEGRELQTPYMVIGIVTAAFDRLK